MFKESKCRSLIRIFSMVLTLLMIIAASPVQALAAKVERPKISAKTAIVMDIDSGSVLYGKKRYAKRNQASITKLMTVTLAAENNAPSARFTINKTVSKVMFSRFPMKVGDSWTVEDLSYGAMLPSSNGCASALAIKTSGSQKAFIKKMNRKAKALGCKHTHFTNPHGLPSGSHYTCAYDTALILRYAYNNERVRKYMGTRRWTATTLKKHQKIHMRNTNKLLGSYNGVLGGKTGTTSLAGNCIATVYQYKGHRYAVVVLGSSSGKKRLSDSRKLYRFIRAKVNPAN